MYSQPSFQPAWTSLVWNVLEYDITSEKESIRERLRATFRTVLEATWNFVPFDAEALSTLLHIEASWLTSFQFTVEGWIAPFWR